MHNNIIQFWFHEISPAQWWKVDPAFDALIRERFSAVHRQFSRNMFRGTRDAFASDVLALALAQEAVACGADQALTPEERVFLYMPYMHSESKAVHEVAERLFREHAPASNHNFELRHKAIIDRFGRYPHRNAALERETTAEEAIFLTEPGSSF
jgi:uncharacterized protein (DUF924 family)